MLQVNPQIKRPTPCDKSLEAQQKQTENIYYLNDRARWQAGRQSDGQAGGRLAQTQSTGEVG